MGPAARVAGTGVLCYACTQDDVWFLLGREREVVGWKQGSRKWSAFSGKLENHERTEEAAAREFVEESCASVPLDESMQLPTRAEEVARILSGEARLERTVVGRCEELSHVTFLKRIPFTDVCSEFERSRARLLYLDGMFRSYYRVKKSCENTPRMLQPGHEFSHSLFTIACVCDKSKKRAATLHLYCDGNTSTVQVAVPHATWEEIKRIEDSLAKLDGFVASLRGDFILEHPAVHIVSIGGHVVNAYVDKAYLEKCEVRWFAVSELQRLYARAMQDGGTFRRFFYESLPDIINTVGQLEHRDLSCSTVGEGVNQRGSASCRRTLCGRTPRNR